MNDETRSRLQAVEGYIIDLDGTLALGDHHNLKLAPTPGAVEWLKYLDERNLPFVIFTNGTVRPPAQFLPLLAPLDFPVTTSSVMTPSTVAAEYFKASKYQRVMAMGGEGVWGPLRDAGLDVVLSGDRDCGQVDAIFIGWFRDFSMLDIEAAVHAIEQGAVIYSASGTPFFTTAAGKSIGTSVVIGGALEAVTGQQAKILGKPSVEAARCAAGRLNLPLSSIAVVGDDPRLEVAMALQSGSMAIYINNGMDGPDAFANLPREQHPHLVLSGVDELLGLYL